MQWVAAGIENGHIWMWQEMEAFVYVIWNNCPLQDSDSSPWQDYPSACFEFQM